MDIVSVIIPVYNNERFLEESLSSVINLNYKDIEIIIIDDGSTDSSLEIIKRFQKLDNRITFFQNKQNIGTAKTIKKGISKSNGKYVFFNAADDISLKYRLEQCLDIFKNNKNIGIIASTAIIINDNGKETGEILDINQRVQNHNIAIEQFKRNYCLGATMAIVNDKDILLKEGMLEYIDDYEISLEYLMNGYNIYLHREPLVKYRIHNDNQSNNRRILADKTKQILRKYESKDIFTNLKNRSYTEEEIYVTLGILNLFKDDVDNAIKLLNTSDSFNNESYDKETEFEKHFYLGVANYKIGNFIESMYRFRLAYKIDSNNPAILNNLAILKFYEKKDKTRSIKMLESALQIYPNYIDAQLNLNNINENKIEDLKVTERILDLQVYKRSQYCV